MAEFQIYRSVEQAVQLLIAEQANQEALPLDETILGVSTINVAQDAVDPRLIRVQITIQVGDFTTVDINFRIVQN